MSVYENIFFTLIPILGLILLVTLLKTIEFYRNKSMFEKIQHCFYDSYWEFSNPYKNARHDEYMSHCASNFLSNSFGVVQHKTNVDSKYKVSTDEKDIALDIIKTFQQWLLRSYLLGHYNDKCFAKLTTDYFLMERLGEFLSENKLNADFNKQEMFVNERKEDGRAIYHFTNYSRVYFKMFYISQVYCDMCLKNNKHYVPHWGMNKIKENIDNDYIEVYL